ncbi:MAG: hypothetical protein R2856_33350 [Caldilineaceae bacterium]
MSYPVYDDPKLFEEMVTTIADCVIGTLTRAGDGRPVRRVQHVGRHGLQRRSTAQPGPLPRYLVPQYRRITHRCAATASM